MDPDEIDWPEEWLPYAVESLLYKKEVDVGTVLSSSTCHYCGAKATTEDHIVPRAFLPKPLSTLPYWFRGNDVVPACWVCNVIKKSHYRSNCQCDHCRWAWATAVGCGFLTVDINTIPVVEVVT